MSKRKKTTVIKAEVPEEFKKEVKAVYNARGFKTEGEWLRSLARQDVQDFKSDKAA
ncbi:hypothetical protein [Rufibacter latericius]|nr:hypothetical protein [Rufibacter latericius]